MKSPKLSVIIPVYKVEKYLDQCIQSVLGQTFKDLEIILVDDGSPDACPQICDAYAAKDTRIRVIHQDNMGLAGARNRGLRLARGEYVAFLDSDDWLEENAYAKLYTKGKQHDADIVFCQAAYYDESQQSFLQANDASSLPLLTGEKFSGVFTWRDIGADQIFSYKSFVVAWNKLCKRSFLIGLQAGFSVGLIYEDNTFYFQTVFAAQRMAVVRQRLVHYRINRQGSITSVVAEQKAPTALHIMGILACMESSLHGLLPPQMYRFFHAYAYREICYKFALIPKELHRKYLSLAKGLLPFYLYWKLCGYIFVCNFKNRSVSLDTFIQVTLLPNKKRVRLFRHIPLLEFEKIDTLPPSHYDSIVAFGENTDIASFILKRYSANSLALFPQWNSKELAAYIPLLVAKKTQGLVVHKITKRPESFTQAMQVPCENIGPSVKGLLAISEKILLVDFAQESLSAAQLKALYYTLNSIYTHKTVHYVKVYGNAGEQDCSVFGLEQHIVSTTEVDVLPILEKALRNVKTRQFHYYIKLSLLGIPLFCLYRK